MSTSVEPRAELLSYVQGHVIGHKPLDAKHLAALVNAAPELRTLDTVEWWSVAVLLAMEIADGD